MSNARPRVYKYLLDVVVAANHVSCCNAHCAVVLAIAFIGSVCGILIAETKSWRGKSDRPRVWFCFEGPQTRKCSSMAVRDKPLPNTNQCFRMCAHWRLTASKWLTISRNKTQRSSALCQRLMPSRNFATFNRISFDHVNVNGVFDHNCEWQRHLELNNPKPHRLTLNETQLTLTVKTLSADGYYFVSRLDRRDGRQRGRIASFALPEIADCVMVLGMRVKKPTNVLARTAWKSWTNLTLRLVSATLLKRNQFNECL